jgi:hypothetical protein
LLCRGTIELTLRLYLIFAAALALMSFPSRAAFQRPSASGSKGTVVSGKSAPGAVTAPPKSSAAPERTTLRDKHMERTERDRPDLVGNKGK